MSVEELLEAAASGPDRAEALRVLIIAADGGNARAMHAVGRCYEHAWGIASDNNVAAAWYKRAAEAGDSDGAYDHAAWLCGTGAAEDETEAFRWFGVAAERGSTDALNMLGRCHEEGWGTPQDSARAAEWSRRAAEAGHKEAAYNFATLLLKGRGVAEDKTEAFRWCSVAAEAGVTEALYMLGRCHEEGWGTQKDAAAAGDLYQRAAEAGHKDAAYNLARSLLNGRGNEEDKTEAFRWFGVAIERGNTDAMNMLGLCHAKGWGTPTDVVAAASCYRRAAETGHKDAAYNLASSLLNGRGVAENRAEAFHWFGVAAERGSTGALYMLGRCHEEGWGTQKDAAAAGDLYQRAAEAGHKDAAYNLARSLLNGRGVAENRADAFRWFSVAAEAGNTDALNMLGSCHERGWGTSEDAVAAFQVYQRAAELDHPTAKRNIGILFATGSGTEKNLKNAVFWLRQATEAGDAEAAAWLARLHASGSDGVHQSTAEADRLFRIAIAGGVDWAKEDLARLTVQPEPTAVPPITRMNPATDPLVSKAENLIASLAVGNPLRRDQMRFSGTRTDRRVALWLRVRLDKDLEKTKHQGCIAPPGSTEFPNAFAAGTHVDKACAEAMASQRAAAAVAKLLDENRAKAFRELGDRFRIGIVGARAHVHHSCPDCARTGHVRCSNLFCGGKGWVQCLSCRNGVAKCTSYGCQNGRVTEQCSVNGVTQSQSRNCYSCSGSGYSGSCYQCNGNGRITCRTCEGEGTLPCGNCGTHGSVTIATTARLVGVPRRLVAYYGDATAGFKAQIGALDIKDIPTLYGDVRATGGPEKGEAHGLTLDCVVPHVELEADFGNLGRQKFDAVGKLASMPRMPTFLDTLLAGHRDRIEDAVRLSDPTLALMEAQTARVTKALLSAAGGYCSLDVIEKLYKGSASLYFLESVEEQLRMAYDRVGAHAVRNTWRALGIPVILCGLAAFPLGVLVIRGAPGLPYAIGMGRHATWMLLSLIVGVLPLAATALLAGARARRLVRSVIGDQAKRLPSQGRWLPIAATCVAAAMSASYAFMSYVGRTDIPIPSVLANVAADAAALAHVAVDVAPPRPTTLSPSTSAVLLPIWNAFHLREGPTVYRVQDYLNQMGFLHDRPDGVMRQGTRAAIAEFMTKVPRPMLRPPTIVNVDYLATAALKGEFRLERLPVDVFQASHMSNLARANLTSDDVRRMQESAMMAAAAPGLEESWRSEDGHRGGRMIVSLRGMGRCSNFDVEVEKDGHVERASNVVFCPGPASHQMQEPLPSAGGVHVVQTPMGQMGTAAVPISTR